MINKIVSYITKSIIRNIEVCALTTRKMPFTGIYLVAFELSVGNKVFSAFVEKVSEIKGI